MKKLVAALSVSAFSLIFFSECKKVGKLTQFEISYNTNVSVPSDSIVVNSPNKQVILETPNVPTEYAAKQSEYKTSKDLIEEIVFTKLSVVATGTATNLDYLKTISVYVKSNAGEELIASKTNIPDGLTTLALDMNSVNIKNHIFENDIKFKCVTTFDATSTVPTQTVKLEGTVRAKGKTKAK